jgi:hypothetical protein
MMVVEFELIGTIFILNAGPRWKFDKAISLVIDCNDQTWPNWKPHTDPRGRPGGAPVHVPVIMECVCNATTGHLHERQMDEGSCLILFPKRNAHVRALRS